MIKHTEFNKMLNNPVRELKGRVELYIYEDSTLQKVCGCSDALRSFTIERVGENKFFGYGICQRLNVKLIDNNRTTSLSTANYLEAVFGVDNDYVYAFPAFYISEVHRDENNNQLSVTAYDALYQANRHTVSELEIPTPYTIRQFANACASKLGLPLNIESDSPFFDLEYPKGANFEGTETLRVALNAIAEVTQTIYYVNNEWGLTFKDLDRSDSTPELIIDKKSYFTLESKTNRRLRTIAHITDLGENLSASIAQSGTTQYIRNNPFLTTRDDVAEILQGAIDRIGGFTMNQFECKWRGNWLAEIGDKIGLVTKDGNTVYSYFLNDVVTFDGTFSEKTQWSYDENDEESETNPVTLGDAIKNTFARVDKMNQEIQLVASNYDTLQGSVTTNAEQIAQIKLNTDRISASVENNVKNVDNKLGMMTEDIEAINKKVTATMTSEEVEILVSNEIQKGTSAVTTTTGFVFDEYGLNISKNTSDISTTISEDGMTVQVSDEVMLTANNQGVVANNLRSNYIIINDRFRFEKYGSDRAGCFWIGGGE